MNRSSEVSLLLTADEALVFYAFLQRFSRQDELKIEDQSEERVLWDLCCLLEKQLVEPLRADYDILLANARDRVRDSDK